MAFTISENYASSHTPPDAVKASLARPQPASVCTYNFNKLALITGTNILVHQFQIVNTKTRRLQLKSPSRVTLSGGKCNLL